MTAKAPVASLKVNYMLGETLIDSQDGAIAGLYVSESASVPYRMYIQKNGKLYQAAAQTGTYYAKNTTLTENTVVEVAVSEVNLKGGQIALLADLDDVTDENAGVRASYCSAYNNKAFTSTEELPAGTYTFIVKALNKGRGSSIKIGETTVCSITDINENKGAWTDKTIENVVIPAAGNLTLVKGESSIDCYDVIIAIKNPIQILTLQAEVGSEVSIKPGVYDAFDIFSVDFGDGVLVTDSVGHQNKGVCVNDGSDTWPQKEGTLHKGITEFKGTVAGDGTIKVYGNSDLWYLAVTGATLSVDQEKLKKVVQFTMSKVAVPSLDLKGLDDMEQFSFTQGSLDAINVSDNLKLKNLTINNNTASAFASTLTAIDLTKNVNLEQLNLMGASATKPGVLTALDLSANTKLTNLYAQNNAIETITLPEGAALTFVNLQNNKIAAIDLSKLASLKDTYLNNNQLTTVDLSKVVAGANLYLDGNQLTTANVPVVVKNLQLNNNKLTSVTIEGATASCKLENNQLTLATMPAQPAGLNNASKTGKFTYAPQADIEVAATQSCLDLSAQAVVAKGELGKDGSYTTWYENVPTVFTVKTTAETPATLVEDVDYVNVDGKIYFLKAQTDKVYVEMTNAAFPKFKGANVLKTTSFTVEAYTEPFARNIEISPAEGDIAAALAAATEGKLVKNITINLAAGGAYTLGATLTAPNNIAINGNAANPAVITVAETFKGDVITLNGTEALAKKSDGTDSDHKLISAIDINGVKILGLAGSLITDPQKTYVENISITDAIVEIPASSKNVINFNVNNAGGYAGKVAVKNSTFYSKGNHVGFFAQYKSRPKNINSNWLQEFDIQNSTFVNIANTKNFTNIVQAGTAQNVYTLKNNIFVDGGKNAGGQVVVGWNNGATSGTPQWTVEGNLFNWKGADMSAAEKAKAEDKLTVEIVKNSVAGVVTFTDAANGNFAGNVEMPFGATEPTTKPGDPRWTLTYSNAPQKYAITVTETTNGTAVADKKEAAAEEKVTITVTPAAGFELDAITGVTATPVEGQDGKYEFTMPAEAVTVTVTFKQTTGIQSVKAADLNDAVIYNLNGARVSKAGKGLYIINGKKVVIK